MWWVLFSSGLVSGSFCDGASKVRDRHSEDVDEEVVSGVKVVLRKPRENAQYKNILQ